MSEPKICASLPPSLLARKVQARPAMGRKMITTTSTLEDLGWNDMVFEPAPATGKAPRTDHSVSTEEVKANPVGRAQNSIVEAFTAMPMAGNRTMRRSEQIGRESCRERVGQ